MKEIINNSAYFGLIFSLLVYFLVDKLKKKTKIALFNPLLFSIAITIAFLVIMKIDYDVYNQSVQYLSYLLTPATVCLAIPLYRQLGILKKNVVAVMTGIISGVLASLFSILLMSYLFKLSHQEYVTLLPKSITAAIGMGISQELGGLQAITVAAIILTGNIGNIAGMWFCKIFKINNPIAVGVAIGTSTHAMGTAKALETGELEGAVSSLSTAVAGLLTVIFASIFANFL